MSTKVYFPRAKALVMQTRAPLKEVAERAGIHVQSLGRIMDAKSPSQYGPAMRLIDALNEHYLKERDIVLDPADELVFAHDYQPGSAVGPKN